MEGPPSRPLPALPAVGDGPPPPIPEHPRPHKFVRLFRRAGSRFGTYAAETKHRFVVVDSTRELLGLVAMGATGGGALLALLLGRALELWALLWLALLLMLLNGAYTFFMVRVTTTLDRRSRRMVQETTVGLCRTRRQEWDLDDVVRVFKQGEGRAALMLVELSSGDSVALTLTGVFKGAEEIKTLVPNRVNNFLRRVRGEIPKVWPPPYLLGRVEFAGSLEGELPLRPGVFLKVLEVNDSGWWKGKVADGSIGYFPVHFTMEVAPSELPRPE